MRRRGQGTIDGVGALPSSNPCRWSRILAVLQDDFKIGRTDLSVSERTYRPRRHSRRSKAG